MGKDSANEFHKSLLLDGRVQLVLCKVTRIKAFFTYAENCRPKQQPHGAKIIQLPDIAPSLPMAK